MGGFLLAAQVFSVAQTVSPHAECRRIIPEDTEKPTDARISRQINEVRWYLAQPFLDRKDGQDQ